MLDGLNDRLENLLKPLRQRLERLNPWWQLLIAVLLGGTVLYLEWNGW